jgi:hypothetical protein
MQEGVLSAQHHTDQQVAPSPRYRMQSHVWFADDDSEASAAGDGILQLLSELMMQ